MPLPSFEVSIDDSPQVQLSYEQYVDEEVSNDPFDILAQLEEDLGVPLIWQ